MKTLKNVLLCKISLTILHIFHLIYFMKFTCKGFSLGNGKLWNCTTRLNKVACLWLDLNTWSKQMDKIFRGNIVWTHQQRLSSIQIVITGSFHLFPVSHFFQGNSLIFSYFLITKKLVLTFIFICCLL